MEARESKRVTMLRRALHMALRAIQSEVNSEAVKPCFEHLGDAKLVAAAEDLTAQMMVQVTENIKEEFEVIMGEYGLKERMLALDNLVNQPVEDEETRDDLWTLPDGMDAETLLRAYAVRSLRAEKDRLAAEVAKSEAEARDLRGQVYQEAMLLQASTEGIEKTLEEVKVADSVRWDR